MLFRYPFWSDGHDRTGSSHLEKPGVKLTISRQESVISDVFINNLKKPAISIIKPLFSDDEFVGMLRWMLSIELITKKLQTLINLEEGNSLVLLDNKGDFLTFIKSNMREQPPEYATIRLINANLKQVDDDKAEELDLGKNECAASAYAAQQSS